MTSLVYFSVEILYISCLSGAWLITVVWSVFLPDQIGPGKKKLIGSDIFQGAILKKNKGIFEDVFVPFPKGIS